MTDNVENVNLEEKTAVPAYTLRPLRDEDLWPVLGIIAEVFPDDLAQYFVALMTKDKTLEDVGYDVGFKLFAAVIKNLPNMGEPVYALLSNLSDIPAADIRKMPFGTTPKMILDIYKNIRNADFFGEFSKLS